MQHSIAKQGEPLWKLLSQDGAYIYVCGCVHMKCGEISLQAECRVLVTSISERLCVHVDVSRDRLTHAMHTAAPRWALT